ncbi:MAG TPA: YeeE/YedE family protein [Polyangiaceae bacterium]|nr:YeeE/YedE family protein [Polyangiaceae bacterium]
MNVIASYGVSLLGGALIGLSASLALLTHGRAAGISGLFGGLFLPGYDARSFRLAFVVGLVAAGLVLSVVYPAAFATGVRSLFVVGAAGLLVGFGTRLGGGCTSGHGVCGLSRLSGRSMVATATFMGTGMVTVFVVRHLLGGGR